MNEFGVVGNVALRLCPDARDAASACLTAGIGLLAAMQTVQPTDKPDEMLDEMFKHLRESFHRLVKDNTETINE